MNVLAVSKLTRKCLILLVLVVGLMCVGSNDMYIRRAEAAPCCENCSGQGDPAAADTICGVNATWYCGQSNPTCWNQVYNDCISEAQQCYSYCVYCFSGQPGGACSSSSDCNINEFCGSDNSCHHY